ncbi:MAG: xanthine dehydrogenase molybdopterin binding subunit [Bacteroidales bacterium]|nr:xanthine dehydrogenase molybdopterin binding subunit [Bacteroidales bacterium]
MNLLKHDSAYKHVTGKSVYVNDIEDIQSLEGHIVYSTRAHARIIKINIEEAKKVKGVEVIITADNIPGFNQLGPVVHDEPCLVTKEVTFIGQAIVLIAANTKTIARNAAKLIQMEYETLPSILTLEASIKAGNRLAPPRKIECGNLSESFNSSDHILQGTIETGGQEHWYLETQSCLAIPGEGKEIKVYSSTQHPSETQTIIAEVLGIPKNEVEVEVRRMGGAFGGKETQGNHVAAWSALLAFICQKPVNICLTRDEDQIMTGKRHRTISNYKVGFTQVGKIVALDAEINLDAGSSTDLTMAITERAMFHVDNAYFIPNLRVTGNTWKTNLPSNTAFRGFGGPQGMVVIENIIDKIARFLGKEAIEIRKLNFYGTDTQNITPYGQKVENNRLPQLFDQLLVTSEYQNRRRTINSFNGHNNLKKRGLAMTPVKFGISFTTSFLNQAAALVNIYRDGTVQVNHGGTEMGQGLHTKILQISASELGISPDRIKVTATNTSKVPNTSATAASSGSDLNGMAVKNATDKLKERLTEIASKNAFSTYSEPKNIFFLNDLVIDKTDTAKKISFSELVNLAYLNQTSLSATGFYKTPGIFYDKKKRKGKPFFYFAFGMAVSEVEIDTLSGHVTVLRTDILHDTGKSLNEDIDTGQIKGGFVQGLGWVTTEVLKYDKKGNLLNHSPDTYKIPTIRDIPKDFRVDILRNAPNPNTIKQSKAVGEPPFMLALSVWLAIKDAVSSVGNHTIEPEFSLPASNEIILESIEKIKEKSL